MRFPSTVRKEGHTYYADGRVADVEFGAGHVTAYVSGTRDYGVELYLADGDQGGKPRLVGMCECVTSELEGLCKHQWALIEHCEERGILRQLRKEFVPTALWRSRVELLERAGRSGAKSRWSGIGNALSRIQYIVDLAMSQQSEYLVLFAEYQRRTRNGTWSQARRLRIDSVDRAMYGDEVDQEVLDMLVPFVNTDSFGYASSSTPDRARIPAAAIAPIMRLACGTGRVFTIADGVTSPGAVRWDDGDAWEIVARTRRNETSVILDYVLRRAEDDQELSTEMVLFGAGLLFAGERFVTLNSSPPWQVLESILFDGPIEVPVKEEARLLQAAAAFGDDEALIEGETKIEAQAPIPLLEISPESGSVHECEIRFAYGDETVPARDPRRILRIGASNEVLCRAWKQEQEALRHFIEMGGVLREVPGSREPQPAVDSRALPQLTRGLIEGGWRVKLAGAVVHQSGGTSFSIKSDIDWFDVEGSMRFAGENFPIPQILKAIRAGTQFIELEDGSVGLLPEESSQQWKMIERLGRSEGDGLRFARNQGWLLDALLSSRESELDADADFIALRQRLSQIGSAQPIEEDESFHGELRAYQRDGLGWIASLRELRLGGCLADDMGLGKTVQMLAALESRRLDAEVTRPSIVVAPKSLIFNWARETARFAPGMRVLTYGGPDRAESLAHFSEVDLIITTYGTLRRDIAQLADIEFDYAILDEAQAVKNSSSQISKAVRLLRASHRLALSGTPIENHLGELWSIFEFLNPGMLGRSTTFRRIFAGKQAERLSDEERERLARALRPFILRRTKEEVLTDLPEKIEQTIFCTLTAEQRADYDEMRDYYRASLLSAKDPTSALPKIHVLEALLRLRQASCHASLLDPERLEEPSAKFEVLMPMLEELREEGHKALIFSQFTKHLSALRFRLDQGDFQYAYLDGRTRNREEPVDRFQDDPDCSLFLISLKAGGHGLNLTAADYVFLLDPWWNPASESQAIDRSHRIGQTRKVMAYRLIARDTAEEKVLELQESKRDLAAAILTADNAVLRDMTREDLELLLS